MQGNGLVWKDNTESCHCVCMNPMGYSKTCPKVLNTGLRDNINDGSLLSKLKTLIYSSLSAEPTLLFDIKILCLCLFDGISKPNNNNIVKFPCDKCAENDEKKFFSFSLGDYKFEFKFILNGARVSFENVGFRIIPETQMQTTKLLSKGVLSV